MNIRGSRGNDVMIGPKYAGCEFHGGAGDDLLIAKSGRRKDQHFFYGGAGNDTLIGGNGRDVLDGGAGNDVIRGGEGKSTVIGGPGNDTIFDGTGGSEIHTGPGRNFITSDGGDDRIHIGAGHNQVRAGEGAVVFYVAYGGVTKIEGWRDSYQLDLSAWPAKPRLVDQAEAELTFALGTSYVVIRGDADPDTVFVPWFFIYMD